MPTQAIVIKEDNTFEDLEDISLESLQGVVGGFVQALSLQADLTAWINEDGKGLELPFNSIPTRIVGLSSHGLLPGDYIAGPCVFTGGTDKDGNTMPLAPSWIALFRGEEYYETDEDVANRLP